MCARDARFTRFSPLAPHPPLPFTNIPRSFFFFFLHSQWSLADSSKTWLLLIAIFAGFLARASFHFPTFCVHVFIPSLSFSSSVHVLQCVSFQISSFSAILNFNVAILNRVARVLGIEYLLYSCTPS